MTYKQYSNRLFLLVVTVLIFISPEVYAQTDTAENADMGILTRENGTVYIMHNYAIPLSHGYHVYRKVENQNWEQLTDAPIFPVQNGYQLERELGDQFNFIQEQFERDDPQMIFLSLRAQSDENTIISATMPELAKLLGRAYEDNDAPVGTRVSYRFDIVNDLEKTTGEVIEGSAVLTPQRPISPNNIEIEHDDRRVQINWEYPNLVEAPDTDDVITFKTYFRDMETDRIVDATDAIFLRTDEDTEFRKYITVPERDREYEFWVEAVDYSGQSSPQGETVRLRIEDNIAPPIIRNVRANANDAYESEITWPVSTELDLDGYYLYVARGEEEEFERLTDELLPPLQTSYLHTDTEPGVQYRYAVTAVDMNGNESQRSNPAHVYIWDYRTPDPVTNLSASFNEEEMDVRLHWQPVDENPPIRTFQILRRQIHPSAGSTYDQLNNNAYLDYELLDKGYENDGFVEGTTLEYGVVEVSQNGNRSDTVWTDIQIPVLTPPEPPASVQTRMRSSDRVQVSWNASESMDVTSYKVYRHDIESDSMHVLAERDRGQRIWRDNDIELNMNYQYMVSAVDSAGNESEPAEGEVIKTHRINPPVGSRNVQAVFMEDEVHLQWQVQNPEQIMGYRIYQSDIATGIFELIGEIEGNEPNFIHSDGEAGQWFKVYPYDALGREARTAKAVQAIEN